MDRKQAELEALLKVSTILGSSFDLFKNLETSMKILSDFLNMRRGTITLLDKDTGELRIVVAHGLTPEQIKKGRYKIGEGIVGRVVETGEPIVVPDIEKEPLFLNRTGARIEKKNISFLCVPIKLKDEILGVLSVDRIFDETISFEEDLRVLKIVATLIAQAIKLYHAFLEEKNRREQLEIELRKKYRFHNIVYASQAMKEIIKTCLKIANTKTAVLIRGESGTGKELIAKAIHYNSNRAKGPFIAINCAAIPENLLEAELFGYEKGAFSGAYTSKKGKFELADGGTIFLDEIGDLPLSLQPKLLRVIQEQTLERLGGTTSIKIDVRIIAATNKNLEEMIEKGLFREDLYYRLNVVPIFLPPLRERKEDIPVLLDYFLEKFNKEYNKNIVLSPEAYNMLLDYEWPGNVRELENLIERLVLLSENSKISQKEIEQYLKQNCYSQEKIENTKQEAGKLVKDISEIEKQKIIEALKMCNFNQTKAAKILGLTRRQLVYRIQKYGLKQLFNRHH